MANTWSSLVGNEQMDRPKSQATKEYGNEWFFFGGGGVNIITIAFCLGQYSLHLLLLKGSMADKFFSMF